MKNRLHPFSVDEMSKALRQNMEYLIRTHTRTLNASTGLPEPKARIVSPVEKEFNDLVLDISKKLSTLDYPVNNNLALYQKMDRQMKALKNKEAGLRFKYNSKTSTISLGDVLYELKLNKTHDFLNHCFKAISTDRKQNMWFYSDLLDSFDHAIPRNKESIKRCKNSLDHLKRLLPNELGEMFKICSKYIKLNAKYR